MGVSAETQGLEAERAVLGSLLIDESCVSAILSSVDERDFTSQANRMIFQAARAVFREGAPVDAVTVHAKLGAAIGTEREQQQYLIRLMELTPTSANWREYAALMREQAALGRIRALASQLTLASTLEETRPLVAQLGEQLSARRGVKTADMAALLKSFADRHAAGQKPDYVEFGLDVLDKNTYVRRGDVVVLGGYPSDGKTALALMMAYRMAKTLKVGFYSLETSEAKIGDRLVTQGMQIDFDAIKRSALTDRDWGTFAEASDGASRRQLHVIEASGMTASDITAHAVSMGFEAIFLDYAQLIVPEGSARDLRSEQMARISRTLHTFAQSRSVLVVELAQLTRPERGAWRAPDMHDLKESGQFEQDADLIVMVYRPDPASIYSREKCRVISIAKSKEGRRGRGVFSFDGAHQTFAPYVREDKAKPKKSGETPDQQDMFHEVPADGTEPL